MIEKLKFIASGLWAFLAPFIRTLMTQAGLALALAATQAVLVVEQRALAGEALDKRDEAFKLIVEDLRRQGLEMAAREVNAAIEAAVVKLNAEKTD